MGQPREDLLGYLLDALEEPERAQVEEALARDDSLQEELAQLRRLLGLLGPARKGSEPPPGLAERTCRQIDELLAGVSRGTMASLPSVGSADWQEEQEAGVILSGRLASEAKPAWGSARTEADPARPTPSAETSVYRMGGNRWEDAHRLAGRPTIWRWSDLLMATAVAASVLLVLFAAIHQSRFRQEITQCQNNLRQLGGGLIRYSELHQGLFPPIPTEGPLAVAGMYGPILISGGFVQEPTTFWCPGAIRQGTQPVPIPTLAHLERAGPEQRQLLVPRLGGSYGYSLGYVEAGQYRPTQNRRRTYFALLADAPTPEHPETQSTHHGGTGQNVCFEDGHVEFITGCRLPTSQDHIFLNHQGMLAPGIGPEDVVVASGSVRPTWPAAQQPTQ